MGPATGSLAIAALFAAAGFVMRWLERREEAIRWVLPDAQPDTWARELAVTADGQRFLLGADGVRVLPPGDLRTQWPVRGGQGLDWNLMMFQRSTPIDPRTRAPLASWVPGARLVPGDLVGARLGASSDPHQPAWRVEALGRDRDYRVWEFAEEEEARGALWMLEHRVVRRPWFDFGPWPPRPEEYARALDQRIATEQQLMNPADEGWTWSASRPGPWFTR